MVHPHDTYGFRAAEPFHGNAALDGNGCSIGPTINARNMGSENSREFSQDSATTPGESVYSSDEEPDVMAQSREEGAVYRLH